MNQVHPKLVSEAYGQKICTIWMTMKNQRCQSFIQFWTCCLHVRCQMQTVRDQSLVWNVFNSRASAHVNEWPATSGSVFTLLFVCCFFLNVILLLFVSQFIFVIFCELPLVIKFEVINECRRMMIRTYDRNE